MLRKSICIGLLFALCGHVSADQTVFRQLGAINFNGDSNQTFFRSNSDTAKWGAPNCPNATYVEIKPSVAGRKEILSIALAAKMSGKQVQFWGFCSTDPNYFNASYIVVE